MYNYKCEDCGWLFKTNNDKAYVNCFVCGEKMEKK